MTTKFQRCDRSTFIELLAEDRVSLAFSLKARPPREWWHRAHFLLTACRADTPIILLINQRGEIVRFEEDEEEVRFKMWKPIDEAAR